MRSGWRTAARLARLAFLAGVCFISVALLSRNIIEQAEMARAGDLGNAMWRLAQIEQSATEQQVRDLFGSPDSVTERDGRTTWCYGTIYGHYYVVFSGTPPVVTERASLSGCLPPGASYVVFVTSLNVRCGGV